MSLWLRIDDNCTLNFRCSKDSCTPVHSRIFLAKSCWFYCFCAITSWVYWSSCQNLVLHKNNVELALFHHILTIWFVIVKRTDCWSVIWRFYLRDYLQPLFSIIHFLCYWFTDFFWIWFSHFFSSLSVAYHFMSWQCRLIHWLYNIICEIATRFSRVHYENQNMNNWFAYIRWWCYLGLLFLLWWETEITYR